MLEFGLVRICAGGVQKWTSLPRTSVDLTHSTHPRAITGICAQRATGIRRIVFSDTAAKPRI